MQGASEQCMQATEMLRSPWTPSLRVTTRRRLTPHGMSCSALQAVTQPLHSMQRSASQMNFIRAIVFSLRRGSLDLTDRRLGLLHHRDAVVAVRRRGVARFAADDRMRALRVVLEEVDTLPAAREVVRHPDRAAVDALGDERAHQD